MPREGRTYLHRKQHQQRVIESKMLKISIRISYLPRPRNKPIVWTGLKERCQISFKLDAFWQKLR